MKGKLGGEIMTEIGVLRSKNNSCLTDGKIK